MNENGAAERWSFGRRLAFCFAFVYLVLYLFPFPLDLIPGIDGLLGPYYDLWSAIVHRAGPAFFGVNITVDPNGSGDTTYNYVQLFVSVVFSA
ncbi:MAG TPA: hypothetical protein VJZ00_11360, partial [Thermoanaerobaculia bacterium]|nr:hypothetical protein [Thermoanaerobaculia bacterium]